MKRMTNEEKINKINDDRITILNIIKENITNKHKNIDESINMALEVIKFDDKNTKEYKAIIEAQNLINDLTNQIIMATTVDEIQVIRKKINYYINKIKKEFEKRNINENELEVLKNNTDYLRKGISSYIRFLKRENNINMINVYNNLKGFSDEDKTKFKKLLDNELRYNKRFINGKENNNHHSYKKDNNIKHIDSVEEELSNNSKNKGSANKHENDKNRQRLFDELAREVAKSQNTTVNSERAENIPLSTSIKPSSIDINSDFDLFDYTSDDYMSNRIDLFKNRYGVIAPDEYGEITGANIATFFRNIPVYANNRKAIKKMVEDTKVYYRGEDLIGYIEYIKKSNSVFRAFKQLFSNSFLYSREEAYLNSHDECMNWIINYFGKTNTSDKTRRRYL